MDSQQHLFLPSEIARLVLGYLQDVKCKITYKSFLKESKDLAEYSTLLKRGITYPTTIMGYTLVNLVNEYGAYKLQESKETSSSSNVLWKQFDVVVKQLKKSTQSKLRQKETQTVRHRKLNKKAKNQKLCASVLDTKETSDEGWVSDNSPFDPVTEETVNSDDSDDEDVTKRPFSKASSSKNSSGLSISDLSSPPYGKVRSKRSKNSANKTKCREFSGNQSMEIDHNENQCSTEKTPEISCRRSLRSWNSKKSNSSASEKESKEKQDNSCADSSVNLSNILVINEDEPKAPSERIDSRQTQNCDNTTEFETHVTEKGELDTIYEASNPCSDEVNANNNFCDVSMRCNGNHEIENGDNNGNQTMVSNETFIVLSSDCQESQSNTVNVVHSFPVPVTPQKSAFRPINVDENSNLKTPVKALTNVHFDQHYKSPRRKRPPRRRADNNITVMGGLSPDNSTCTQFSTNPPGPEMDENTMTDYAHMIDKLLEDTKLHEILADNINKKLVPRKDNVVIKSCDTIKNSTAVHSELGPTPENIPSTSTVSVNVSEQHDTVQPYISEHQDVPTGTDNLSNDNLSSMLGGVIKGIADVTGNDPSLESIFSLFMNAKESSVHDEVDQMIIQSNQDDIQNNQTDELHTPTDIKENFLVNPDNQQQIEQHPLTSPYLNQNTNNPQTQYNADNTPSMVNNNDVHLKPASENYQKQLSSESTKNSICTTNNSSSAQTTVCNTGNSSQTLTRQSYPAPIHVNSNSNNSNSQSANQECNMYNIANINSPAISVISINSPDTNSVSTPERTTKIRRPKRITPTPLNGTEILPLHGKIASPQKPLIIIPENKQFIGGKRPGKHFPPPLSNSNSRNSHFSDGHSDNSQHSNVELPTPLQSTLIGTGYPLLTQAQLNETSVSDITLSPGGNHLLAHNKRTMVKAIEENSAFVLSPITPINENTKLASSTPYPNSIPECSLSENSGKSPKKEFKKPNLLSKAVSRASPKTETASSNTADESVLCYSLSPLKTDANVIHGTVNDVPFTAVPMGQMSRRFCHVRNLDFGREQPSSSNVQNSSKRRSLNKCSKSDSKSKKDLLPKKISTCTPEKVEKLKVRPLLPRQTTTKPINIQNQPAEPIVTIVNPDTLVASNMSPKVILNKLENKQKPKERRKSAGKVKIPKETTESKAKTVKAKSKRKSDPTTKKASPVKNNKGKSSSQKKRKTPKKSTPQQATNMVEDKNLKITAPVDAIDILDADTKEFNQRLENVNVIDYGLPIDLSAGSTNSQINIVSVNEVSNQFETADQNETKAAAEVLASLSMLNSFASVANDPFKSSSLSSEDNLALSQSSQIPAQNNTAVQGNPTKQHDGETLQSNVQSEPTDLSIPKSNIKLNSQSSLIVSSNIGLSSGKRKAEEFVTDSLSSPNSCPEPRKKKMKKKKSIDLSSVNIDALLSKVKYAT